MTLPDFFSPSPPQHRQPRGNLGDDAMAVCECFSIDGAVTLCCDTGSPGIPALRPQVSRPHLMSPQRDGIEHPKSVPQFVNCKLPLPKKKVESF